MNPVKPTLKQAGWHLLGWGLAVLVCGGVFALYMRPDFLLRLADQLWACF